MAKIGHSGNSSSVTCSLGADVLVTNCVVPFLNFVFARAITSRKVKHRMYSILYRQKQRSDP